MSCKVVSVVCVAYATTVLASMSYAGMDAPALQVSPPEHAAVAPDVAVNVAGEIAILWVDRAPEQARQSTGGEHDNHLSYTDLYAAISRDGGLTFAEPVKINHDAGVVWGQTVSRPRIVAGLNGHWHVGYTANEIHANLGKPVLTAHYTRSADDGATFEAPHRLSTVTDADMSHIIHGGFMSAAAFGTIAASPDGGVHMYWIDTRHMSATVESGALYAASSRDGGATFSSDRELQAVSVCPCCQMMAIADQSSNVYLGWRQVTDAGRQSTIARIAPDGTMGAPVDTGGAPWKIDACPLKPTVIATQGDTVLTAVYNGGEEKPGVYFSYSLDGGKSFVRAIPAHPDALVSDAPSIAVNDRYALLVWHAKTGGPRQIFARMFDLNGQPAGNIAEITSGPENAQNAVVAVRADGQFQVAWQQSNGVYTRVLSGTRGEIDVVQR